jgi:hypothetical protein
MCELYKSLGVKKRKEDIAEWQRILQEMEIVAEMGIVEAAELICEIARVV